MGIAPRNSRAAGILAAALSIGTGGCAGPGKEPTANAVPPAAAGAPPSPGPAMLDWRRQHHVPESDCTFCSPSAVRKFKKVGDWRPEHDLPDSQCIACHPELEAKLKAMAPKAQ